MDEIEDMPQPNMAEPDNSSNEFTTPDTQAEALLPQPELLTAIEAERDSVAAQLLDNFTSLPERTGSKLVNIGYKATAALFGVAAVKYGVPSQSQNELLATVFGVSSFAYMGVATVQKMLTDRRGGF